MGDDAEIVALADAQLRSRQTIADRVVAYLVALWGGFTGWYSPAEVDRTAERAWRAVSAGQVQTAAAVDNYLSRTSTIVRGEPVAPVGVAPGMRESLRRDVTGPEVQARIAKELRWNIYRNDTLDDAMNKALERVGLSVSEDMALAGRGQADRFGRKRMVRAFARVTRGENTCGLCAAASNRLYYRADLMPIHAHCRCTVIEVSPQVARNQSRRPQDILDDRALFYQQAQKMIGKGITGVDEDGVYATLSNADYRRLSRLTRSNYARDLKDIRYVVDDHGELGPVLRNVTQRDKTTGRDPAGGYLVDNGRRSTSGHLDKRSPEEKKLDVNAPAGTRDPAEVRKKIQQHRETLKFVLDRDLPEQVTYHRSRIDMLESLNRTLEKAK